MLPPAGRHCPSTVPAEEGRIEAAEPSPRAAVLTESSALREGLQRVLEAHGFRVGTAEGAAALLGAPHAPSLVLTDLRAAVRMGLVGQPRSSLVNLHPGAKAESLWVALVERPDDAAAALDAGALGALAAASTPVPNERDLDALVARLRHLIGEMAHVRQAIDTIAPASLRLTYLPRPDRNAEVIRFLGGDVRAHYVKPVGWAELQLALHEALANALEHGNLGITGEEKSEAMHAPGGVHALIRKRLDDAELAARTLHIEADYGVDSVTYRITDGGTGFDARRQSNAPMVPVTALHGRGLMLIRHVMDEVHWNDTGNCITMRRQVDRPEAS